MSTSTTPASAWCWLCNWPAEPCPWDCYAIEQPKQQALDLNTRFAEAIDAPEVGPENIYTGDT